MAATAPTWHTFQRQAPPARGLPLVLELHGRGIDAVMFDRLTGFMDLARESGFALVAPSA